MTPVIDIAHIIGFCVIGLIFLAALWLIVYLIFMDFFNLALKHTIINSAANLEEEDLSNLIIDLHRIRSEKRK